MLPRPAFPGGHGLPQCSGLRLLAADRFPSLREQSANLVIRRLVEVAVELANGVKAIRTLDADEPVHFLAQLFAGALCGYGSGDEDSAGEGTHGPHGGFHCRSRGQAIIDQDDRTACENVGGAPIAVRGFAALDLDAFAGGCRGKSLERDTPGTKDVVLSDDDAATGDGSHGQLLFSRNAEFANDEDVERKMEPMSHLKRNGHAAAWQAEDDALTRSEFIRAFVLDDLRQRPAGVPPILKDDDHSNPSPALFAPEAWSAMVWLEPLQMGCVS